MFTHEQYEPERSRSIAERLPAGQLDRLIARITLTDRPHAIAPLRAPFTGEVIRDVPLCDAEDVAAAVRSARAAQRAWAARSFAERAAVILRFHDLLFARQDEILDIIQLENGKARKDAFDEVAEVAMSSRYYAYHAEEHLAPVRRRGAFPALTVTWEHHHPVGVVGLITPWNYPLTLPISDAIPAWMAGNAVVIKPDQQTPFTTLWAARLLDEAGLPEGLLHVVTGRGRELGRPLIDEVDYIAFTGSTATGRQIARQAADRLIGCSMELGGKNPMLVLADADIDKTVDGALRGCFSNAGQLCIAMSRLYVHESLYEPFLARFAARARAMRVGASFEYDTDMGSLVSQDQLDKVEGHVRDALSKGAVAVAGGVARPELGPYFFEPTILVGVDDRMHLAREETFGPVAALYRFSSIDDAVARANDTPYGLNASVWTDDVGLGMRVAARLQCGTVNVNEAFAAGWASLDSPMGGFKQSGIGRRHGAVGIRKYTETQTIAAQRLLPMAAPAGVSQAGYARMMTGALRLLRHIPGLR